MFILFVLVLATWQCEQLQRQQQNAQIKRNSIVFNRFDTTHTSCAADRMFFSSSSSIAHRMTTSQRRNNRELSFFAFAFRLYLSRSANDGAKAYDLWWKIRRHLSDWKAATVEATQSCVCVCDRRNVNRCQQQRANPTLKEMRVDPLTMRQPKFNWAELIELRACIQPNGSSVAGHIANIDISILLRIFFYLDEKDVWRNW